MSRAALRRERAGRTAPRPALWAACWSATSALLFVASLSGQAHAFCRTTTCDPTVSCSSEPEDCCRLDSAGCDTNGIPLFWPTSCVSYSTHQQGSELRDISSEALREVIGASFDAWLASDCGASTLSISVEDRGFASCGQPEFNEAEGARNANVWMFREDDAAFPSSRVQDSSVDAAALAVSIVSFDFRTGEIVDVDVELNSDRSVFTTTELESEVVIDLQSVVTHEAGHFLGLDHTDVREATMDAGYLPGTLGQRSLHPDDEAGLCAIYPEARSIAASDQTCQPRGGYSASCYEEKGCGCRSVGRGAPASAHLHWIALLVAAVAWRARRAGARPG